MRRTEQKVCEMRYEAQTLLLNKVLSD